MAQAPYAFPNQQLPGEVYQQAAMYQLGEMRQIYKPTFTNPFTIIGMVIGTIILDIIALVVIANLTGYIYYILIVIPIVAIIYAIYGLLTFNLKVYVFTYGFVGAKGSAIDVVRWDQIEAVWERIMRSRYGLRYTYTVRRGDGKIFKYGNVLKGIANLGSTIQQEVTRIQLPRAIAAFKAGQQIPFGPINVAMQGVNNGKEIIPWNQIGSITIKRGVLAAQIGGRFLRWSSVKARNVPNLGVLIGLVDYVVRGQGQGNW